MSPVVTPEWDDSEEIYSYYMAGTMSGDAAKSASGGYQGAGWYTASSNVPEPTSGLLMLLGVAGLALKRKRA